jgi:hypothetical protein
MARWAAATGIAAFMLVASVAEGGEFGHVRSEEPPLRTMLRRGCERSATFRALVEEIDSLPGIVYVASTVRLSRHMDGALLHVKSGAQTIPILRVLIRTGIAGDYAISVLAHELQHVLEVLHGGAKSAASIADTFAALDDGASDAKFETPEARAIGERVLRELRSNPRR